MLVIKVVGTALVATAALLTGAELDAATETTVELDAATDTTVELVAATALDTATDEDPEEEPGPATEVVISPLSTYTPLKYQSSGSV